jgi:hypothetical protein
LSSPETIVKKAREKGLAGIAITDHDMCKAWNELAQLAKRENLVFVRGEEIKVKENGETRGEISGLFMNSEVKPGDFGDVVDALQAQDAIAVIQHPFDWFRKPFKGLDSAIKRVNALEVFNSRCILPSMNEKALQYARQHNLIQMAGSDAHTPWEIGQAFIECDCSSEEELRVAILKRKTSVGGKLSFPLIHLFSPLAKKGLIKRL